MMEFDELMFDNLADGFFETESDGEAVQAHPCDATAYVVDDPYFVRSQAYWQQIPIPAEQDLAGTNVLASLDDETLLTMSPSLIVHVQRTEASGGMQVVSPRSVTLGGVAARTNQEKRSTDMFLVGSAASRNTEWPVLEGSVPDHLFWNEPIDAYPSDAAPRPRTVSSGILSTTSDIDDPITKSFLIGRALVDLQRRPDVAGTAEELARVLSGCWGMDAETYEDMGEASLAPVGPLLRYAIRSDAVYPMINAPIQARKCISVGANTAGRLLYGDSSAIDWRRMRVLAESVFYQSSRLENWTLSQMVTDQPPGNPRAPAMRPGILQMRPLPGSVWTFDSTTFRIDINTDAAVVPAVRVPDRVRAAVARFHQSARPTAHAAAVGVHVSFSRTMKMETMSDSAESIIRGFTSITRTSSAFSARGKTSAAAVRGFMYECLAESTKLSSIRALWLARYMHDTTMAMNLTHLLDIITTRQVAARLSDVTADMRIRIGVEAGRRGSDLGEWWDDLRAQLPREIASMSEGTATWALASAHLVLHPPTPKWSALVRAMGYASHSALARGHLSQIRLPAMIGSAERTFEAARAVARQLGISYGAYYGAMYDVACVLSDRLSRAGNKVGASKVRVAGLMWDIRSKVASTVVLKHMQGTSPEGGVVITRGGMYHMSVSPYNAYQRWRKEMNDSTAVSRSVKAAYPHHAGGILSKTFEGMDAPLFSVPVGASARLWRYALKPSKLHLDIESTLREILEDVQAVADYYDAEESVPSTLETSDTGEGVKIEGLDLDMSRFQTQEGGYWDLVTQLDQETATDVVDAVLRMDLADAAEIEHGTYASPTDLVRAVWHIREAEEEFRAQARDAIK